MSDLLDISFTQQKVRSVLSQIKRMQSDEFPYREPSLALGLIERLCRKDDLARLEQVDASTDPDVRRQACAHANQRIAFYHPLLGFILRSTNVRNAFEAYDPLLQICRRIYGTQAKLILSSEWSFSPFTYPASFKDLPDLIFIGLPATEAGNALILPLTGHELGHSVWRRPAALALSIAQPLLMQLQTELVSQYKANWSEFQSTFNMNEKYDHILTNLFLRSIWSQSYRLAQRQIEELFCDILGLAIFGEGFLYSFIYVLSPNLGDRAPHYPPLNQRIQALKSAATKFSIGVPPNFDTYFSEPQGRLPTPDAFVLKMADNACASLISAIVDSADNIASMPGAFRPNDQERDRIAQHFCSLSPAPDPAGLADIINAGWYIRLNPECWERFEFSEPKASTVLNDLVFKTIEVLEYRTRVDNEDPPNA